MSVSDWLIDRNEKAIGTASANSLESDLGCTSRVYFDNVTLHANTITSLIAVKQTVITFHKML